MTSYSLFFPALSQVSPLPSEKWRIATKTASTYNNYLSMELVFSYTDNAAQFDLTNNRMTLFHQGTDASTSGIAVVLKKTAGGSIQLGLISSTGTAWTEIASSFVDLNTIGSVASDSFYVLLTYDYSGSNQILNFYVVAFNLTVKTAPDFSYTTSSGPAIEPIGNQWGFGSSPQSITDAAGYVATEGYNCYVAQNIQTSFLRTWNINPIIPATSSTSGQFAMFNSVDATTSLYTLNRNSTQVAAGTTNLNFQLYMTGAALNDIYNSSVSPNVAVTQTTSTSAYPTLTGFAINSSGSYNVPQNSSIACILKGTKILTDSGYKLIEDITMDDKIVTHDNRIVKINDIHMMVLYSREKTAPRIIKKGEYNAFEDLYISEGHGILIDDYFDYPFNLGLEQRKLNELLTYYLIRTENFLTDTLIANGVIIESWGGWLPDIKTDDWVKIPDDYYNDKNLRKLKEYFYKKI